MSEGTLKKQAYKSNGIVAALLHSLAVKINVFRYSLYEYEEEKNRGFLQGANDGKASSPLYCVFMRMHKNGEL